MNAVKKPKKVIAIVGPTASGKTGIGVRLAKEFNGEIVSVDSRQVYRGLDIGTGKDLCEYDGVRYHMIDIADPMEKMTLFDYLPMARKAIEDILNRGKLPIIVGGTGLYIQGLVEGFELEAGNKYHPYTPPKLGGEGIKHSREQLDKLSVKELNSILEKLDPDKYEKVDKKNKHRLIRSIELAQEGVKPIKIKPDFEVLQIGIDVPRNILHERIDKRVDERFDQGMGQEVLGLLSKKVSPQWLLGLGLEYRVIAEYLLGITNDQVPTANKISTTQLNKLNIDHLEIDKLNENWKLILENSSILGEMSQKLKWRIHQFARRQLTWFRRIPEINWLSDYNQIKRFVQIFLTH